jgi:hypothetical protein
LPQWDWTRLGRVVHYEKVLMSIDTSGNRDVDHRYLQYVREGNLEGVRSTLAEGANPLIRSKGSMILTLVCSVANTFFHLMDTLHGKEHENIIINSVTALHIAAKEGHAEIVEELVKSHPELIPMTDSYNANALFWAEPRCLKILLNYDLNVNHKDIHGRTPLYTMAYKMNVLGASMIIEKIKKSKADHVIIDSTLNEKMPKVLIVLITEYYGGVIDKNDILVPEFFLEYIPGSISFTEKDWGFMERVQRDGVTKVNALFMEYGVNLSECRIIKDGPYGFL